jgi:HEAT repeat protein
LVAVLLAIGVAFMINAHVESHSDREWVGEHWIRAVNDGDPQVRKLAVERLVAALEPDDPLVVEPVQSALVRSSHREEVIAVLLEEFRVDQVKSYAIFIRVAEILLLMAPEGHEAMARVLREEPQPVKCKLLDGLERVGPRASPLVPILVEALSDPDKVVRLYAAMVLGKIGPPARKARADLQWAMEDPDGYVRVAAAQALWRIDPQSPGIVPFLCQTLQHDAPSVDCHAAQVLGEMGPSAPEEAVTALIQSCGKNEQLYPYALEALRAIAPEVAARVHMRRKLSIAARIAGGAGLGFR